MAKLTIKQQRFADEYIISGNATQAAISAGYAEKSLGSQVKRTSQNFTLIPMNT